MQVHTDQPDGNECVLLPLPCVHVQGQASDILIQAKEIERLRDLLISLYVKHCGQDTEGVGEATRWLLCCQPKCTGSFRQ